MAEEEKEGHKSPREGDETRAEAILALSLQLGGFVGVHGGYDERGLLENGQLPHGASCFSTSAIKGTHFM
ncbi:hypothetical protein TIFTF001_050895 [Ficus carica]|uniref:Uncharacterized protein n=1 Tax=Ficus carica TaxID=3494 RepID=A0AA88CIV0_FICCA|nr:hypothetical protein TIFTF001_050892 [Ficus carica]GMN19055.1 hypothetical protein TIFTF001_050893 [Ficus carica]GMN19065.1 hypothetical protein TIFTF001_050894 [Ficus carica]GMN19075.1 hypothetical protein TIFTF001_050895 [Ficus carica]